MIRWSDRPSILKLVLTSNKELLFTWLQVDLKALFSRSPTFVSVPSLLSVMKTFDHCCNVAEFGILEYYMSQIANFLFKLSFHPIFSVFSWRRFYSRALTACCIAARTRISTLTTIRCRTDSQHTPDRLDRVARWWMVKRWLPQSYHRLKRLHQSLQ